MPQDWKPVASLQTLQQRAQVLRAIRQWFFERDVLEVETPVLVSGATTDPHIDSFTSHGRQLRTSSEFHQKRLLAAGIGDNYEIGKVFRVDESGRFHNPEFTMLEWYRCGIDHHQLIGEVADLLIRLHGDECPAFKRMSYRDLWRDATGIDIASADAKTLEDCFNERDIAVPADISDRFDDLLDLGMATFVSDTLASDAYTCVYHYPASQASLARVEEADSPFPYACRFEVFYGKVELANGYYELSDAREQLSRFNTDNSVRREYGKPAMPVDHRLIAALEHGLPDCAGVAIGLDRLLMILLNHIDHISDTLSFDWSRA